MKTSEKERDTSRLLSRTRGVIWIAAFFVCLYPHQEQGPAQWSGSLLFARQVSNSTTAKCDLKSCFDFFLFLEPLLYCSIIKLGTIGNFCSVTYDPAVLWLPDLLHRHKSWIHLRQNYKQYHRNVLRRLAFIWMGHTLRFPCCKNRYYRSTFSFLPAFHSILTKTETWKIKHGSDRQTWRKLKRTEIVDFWKLVSLTVFSKFIFVVCYAWYHAWDVYLLVKKLWFFHLERSNFFVNFKFHQELLWLLVPSPMRKRN